MSIIVVSAYDLRIGTNFIKDALKFIYLLLVKIR